MERKHELRMLTESRGGDNESKILGQPGRGGGEFGEGGDGVHDGEVQGRRPKQGGGGDHGGNGRARTTNATINYVLNTCNRFRGCGGGEDGRSARIRMSAPDLRFGIRRSSWVRTRLALAATAPAAPIRHPNPWGGGVGKGLVPLGRKKEPLRCNSARQRRCNTLF